MGNLPLPTRVFRAPAVPEPIPEGKFLSSRISSGITYFYAPFSGDSACSANVPLRNSSSSSSPPLTPLLSHVDTTTPSQHRLDVAPTSRPLLLFFSWLGAQPGPVSKYRDLYLNRGMDVLVIQSGVMHFLWPRWGLSYGLEVLKLLEEPQFSGRAVLVHATSIGGYTFTQILTHIARGRKEHAGLAQRVIGHVYDSLVFGTLEHMAIGLGKTLVPRFEGFVKNAALLYFWLFKRQTADVYDSSIRVFHNSPITSPALFFFSENDALCDQAVVEKCIDHWRRRGVSVASRKWKESIHAAHMRCHPEDYHSTLENFLNSLVFPL
ncbi:uncharacterized protein LOC130518948 [Takifugu flavidus]|uniref:uncharacterized protein LOC130518948 n=1 Tax=Takifugu flavidus TaxID=433684 RepID=UPI000298E3EB|nr:uncharacterized protein LOC130518948 [Takifugu flavidus]|eukprot:XP_003972904.1 PREDICTED: uncharacterized protein LOC101078410 [Takifugu rubripes]